MGFGFDPNTVAELYLEQQRGVIEHRFFQRYCNKLAVQEHSLANQALEGEQHVTGQEPRKTSKYLNALRRFYAENSGTITRMSVESLSQVLPDDSSSRHGYTPLMLSARAGVARTFSDVHFLGGKPFYLPFLILHRY